MPELLEQLSTALSDRYAFVREIGRGGMATVFLARDIKHDRQVAVKVLNPELGAVLGVERFLAEIKVTANLQHPNLLPLFDSGEARPAGSTKGPGLLFYVMPYVEGETLRERLEREKQLPVDDALRIATAVASALDYAHRHGVIHRDLKPENILLHEGQPLIADFGIALAVSNAGGSRVTQTGISLGTPSYMSPEQATGDRDIDGRTDIYSLGAVVYEMLAGEPPHTGRTAQAVIARLIAEIPRSVRLSRQSVPEPVANAIQHALEKLPADRWHTAHEFADALNGKSTTVVTGQGAGTAVVNGQGASFSRRAVPWLVAAIATVVAIWLAATRSAPTAEPIMRVPIAESSEDGTRISELAFAPDGQSFAYIAIGPDNVPRIYVRRLDEVRARSIPGTENPSTLFVSPDGAWIGFAAGRELKKVRSAGGAPTTIATFSGFAYGASWAVDSAIVLSSAGGMFLVSSSGGTPTLVRSADEATEPAKRFPLALPDGEHVIFTRWTGDVSSAVLGVISLITGNVRMLPLKGSDPKAIIDGHLIFLNASGGLAAAPFDERTLEVKGPAVPVLSDVFSYQTATASISRNGSLVYQSGSNLRDLVEWTATSQRTLAVKAAEYEYPRYSQDGRRLAVSMRANGSLDIWILRAGSATLERLTSEGTENSRAEWTADGRVLFRSNRSGGHSALWLQRADGTAPAEKVLEIPNVDLWEGVLTPDGKTLLYRTGTQGGADIWYKRLDKDSAAHPLAITRFAETAPRVSPDGKWVAYSTNESGTLEIYVRSFPSLEHRFQVSNGGGNDPVWSRDGQRLYFHIGGRVLGATLKTAPEMSVTRIDTVAQGDLFMTTGHPSFDALPDGKGVLVLRRAPGRSQTIVVTGWKRELRDRTKK